MEEKPVVDFPKRAKSKDGLLHMCKVCKRAYDKAHYKANPHRREYIRANSDKRIAEVREYLLDYLLTHPCIDCGESDIVVLEFDHRGDKRENIASLQRTGNLETIKSEVAKCDVRCANCHRRKTARDFGFWRMPLSSNG